MPAHYSAHYSAGVVVWGSRLFTFIPLPLWPEESLFAAQPVEFQPFPETFGVFLLHQEKPAESGIFLRQEAAHAGLVHEVATVSVGEESFSGILRVLGVHFPAEDGPEFFGPVRVQVGGGEAGAEGEPGSV